MSLGRSATSQNFSACRGNTLGIASRHAGGDCQRNRQPQRQVNTGQKRVLAKGQRQPVSRQFSCGAQRQGFFFPVGKISSWDSGEDDGGVPELGGSARLDRSLDQGVQSRPASSRNQKSYSARGFLGFHSCTKFGDPDCLVLKGALQVLFPLQAARLRVQPQWRSQKATGTVLSLGAEENENHDRIAVTDAYFLYSVIRATIESRPKKGIQMS